MKIEKIGDCTLYLADCTDVLSTLGKVDAVVTDPPYGVNLTGKRTKGGLRTASKNYRDTPEYVAGLVQSVSYWALENASRSAITPGNRSIWLYPEATDVGCFFAPSGGGLGRWGFVCSHPILFYGRDPYLEKGMGSRPNSYWSKHPGGHITGENKIDHPCPKPIDWMLWLVARVSMPGETVLDPFMGSGTTGVACARLGRKFIGIEIDPEYFDLSCDRIRKAYAQPDMFVERPAPPKQEALL